MRETDDWRLNNQERYLKGVVLAWRPYKPRKSANDRDYCEFCFAKFMESGVDRAEEVLSEGYATEDRYHWICKTCFDDFKDMFSWWVIGTPGNRSDADAKMHRDS